MKKKTDRSLSDLYRTLESAGVSRVPRPTILDGSAADEAGNRRVHESTNRKIVELLSGGELGTCIHVTGDARAMTDPFHRRVCEEMRRLDKGTFRVLYKVPSSYTESPVSLVSWNLTRWSRNRMRRWDDELRTIWMIGNRSVNLYSYEAQDEIQYSVFGNRYVLLQEKHPDLARSKRVWLLDSRPINEQLTERARDLLAKATDLDEASFLDFARAVSGLISMRYLSLLQAKPRERQDLFTDSVIRDYAIDSSNVLEALQAMAFIKTGPADLLNITDRGAQFLALQSQR